jgi:hypothetical protein
MKPEDLHEIRWQAIIEKAAYRHDFGLETAWRKPENAWWGSPLTEDELELEDGRKARVFANACVAYNSDGTVEVLS